MEDELAEEFSAELAELLNAYSELSLLELIDSLHGAVADLVAQRVE